MKQVDNGPELNDIRFPRNAKLSFKLDNSLFGGIVLNSRTGICTSAREDGKTLYAARSSQYLQAGIEANRYSLGTNREPGETLIWILE